jgi:hypothetical protein
MRLILWALCCFIVVEAMLALASMVPVLRLPL